MRVVLGLLVGLLALLAGAGAHAAPPKKGLSVFAASSLTDAFHDLGTLWLAQGHPAIRFNFASSSTLAQQIQHGAPADVFASADELWMDKLAAANLIRTDTRADFVGNTLVVVEPKASLKPVAIKPGFDLGAYLGTDGRLAIGDPAHVPAGIYAEQALRKLGMWDSLRLHLAPAENVRAALMLVSTGQSPAGIVYGSDARAASGVGVAGVFPADSHEPIRYPAALTMGAVGAEPRAFLDFLHSQAAQDVFNHYGFLPP